MFNPFKTVLRTVITLMVAAGAVGTFVYVKNGDEENGRYFKVSRQNLSEEILVTGTIISQESLELSFERTGRVSTVYTDVGKVVLPGQILVGLERGIELAALEDAKAALRAEEAALEALKIGTRKEEIAIKETAALETEQKLLNYYKTIPQTIEDVSNEAQHSVYKLTDALYDNDNSNFPTITFLVSNGQIEIAAKEARSEAGAAILRLSETVSRARNGLQGDVSLLQAAKEEALIVQNFLTAASEAVNNAVNLNETTLTTYKADLNTAKTSISAEIVAVENLTQNIASQEIAAIKTRQELDLAKAGATVEELIQAESKVESKRAQVDNAVSTLEQKLIRSPIRGLVTKIDAKVGQIIMTGENAIYIISPNDFQIESYVPEADIAKIQIGNPAIVTLDAYGNDVKFGAKISFIEPGDTVIDGVPTYKTTLQFDKDDERIKSGMTANVTVVTNEKTGVVAVPARMILREDRDSFVFLKQDDGGTEKRKVETGVRGSRGFVEILNGLEEGETITEPEL
ncbi:MAG: efflux RND transporter periplasmic adaptor subunit [bacterium]|nr:efflux RND transporter periplasmic adaptor subunit [bacterium]